MGGNRSHFGPTSATDLENDERHCADAGADRARADAFARSRGLDTR